MSSALSLVRFVPWEEGVSRLSPRLWTASNQSHQPGCGLLVRGLLSPTEDSWGCRAKCFSPLGSALTPLPPLSSSILGPRMLPTSLPAPCSPYPGSKPQAWVSPALSQQRALLSYLLCSRRFPRRFLTAKTPLKPCPEHRGDDCE